MKKKAFVKRIFLFLKKRNKFKLFYILCFIHEKNLKIKKNTKKLYFKKMLYNIVALNIKGIFYYMFAHFIPFVTSVFENTVGIYLGILVKVVIVSVALNVLQKLRPKHFLQKQTYFITGFLIFVFTINIFVLGKIKQYPWISIFPLIVLGGFMLSAGKISKILLSIL